MSYISFFGGVVIGVAGKIFVDYVWEGVSKKDGKISQTPSGNYRRTESEDTVRIKPAQDDKPIARLVMQKEIMHFNDLLEPLYMVSQGRLSSEDAVALLEEWEQRLFELTDADNVIRKWKIIVQDYKSAALDELKSIAVRWLNLLASFEISRDNHNEVQVNESVRRAYEESDRKALIDGEYMIVKSAAWFKKNDVIRRGILVRKDA